MSTEPYTNRELDEKFKGIHEKLDSILEQTTKHNGRMRKIEWYIAAITGGLIVVSIIVVPLFLNLIGK